MNASDYYTQQQHGAYSLYELGDFVLEQGRTIRNCKLAYATFGQLNAQKDNAILIPTWFSGSHQIIEQVYIGQEHALNPDKYFIIVVNQLGGGLSSSPHNSDFPQNAGNFPQVEIADDVKAQHRLLTEKFSLETLALVTGGSMGAQQTYEWAVRYPQMVKRAAPMAGTAKITPHNRLFTEAIIDSITSDPGWNHGDYQSSCDVRSGLRRLAKLFGLMGWSSEFYKQQRWQALGFSSVEDFMIGFMQAYFGVMDANNLLLMARKWQLADVSRGRGSLADALGQIKAKTFILSIDEDMMFPSKDSEAEREHIPDCEHHIIHSIDGHLALFGTDSAYVAEVDNLLARLLAS